MAENNIENQGNNHAAFRMPAGLRRIWSALFPPGPGIECTTLQTALATCFGRPVGDADIHSSLSALRGASLACPYMPGHSRWVHVNLQRLHVKVDAENIYTKKTGLTAREAHDLAFLARVNPALRTHGLTPEGDAADRYLLTLAARAAGLTITGAEPELDPAHKAAIDKQWQSFCAAPNAPAETKPAASTNKIGEILADANVSSVTYDLSKQLIIDQQKATQAMLRRHFNISAKQAKAVLAALTEDGVVKTEVKTLSKPRTTTRYHVLADKDAEPRPHRRERDNTRHLER